MAKSISVLVPGCRLVLSEAENSLFEGGYILRPLKKRCKILPAGGLGVSPSLKSPTRLGMVIVTISAVSGYVGY